MHLQAQGVALLEMQAEKLDNDGKPQEFLYSFFKIREGDLVRLPDHSFGKGDILLITPANSMPGKLKNLSSGVSGTTTSLLIA